MPRLLKLRLLVVLNIFGSSSGYCLRLKIELPCGNYLVKGEFSSMSELAKSLRLPAQQHVPLTLQLVF